MRKTKVKILIISIISLAVLFCTARSVNAAEEGFEVKYDKQGNDESYITIIFDKEIDVEYFEEDKLKASSVTGDFYVVNNKTIKSSVPKRGSSSFSMKMADGSRIQVWYSTDEFVQNYTQNYNNTNNNKGHVEKKGDIIEGEFEEIKWTYDTKSATLKISGEGTLENKMISSGVPEFILNLNGEFEEVDSEENGVFIYEQDVKHIKIEKGIRIIDWNVFDGCDNLISVEIDNGLEVILMGAFDDCKNLEKVIIPSSVYSIDDWCFRNCENLTIYCEKNSAAHKFAEKNNIKYELINIQDKQEEKKKEFNKDLILIIVVIIIAVITIIVGFIAIFKLISKK